MENLALWLGVFCVGVLVGVVIASLSAGHLLPKKQHVELAKARQRILAGIKESHDREILREIFRATDALNGEVDRSLRVLKRSVEQLLTEVQENGKDHEFGPQGANKNGGQTSPSST